MNDDGNILVARVMQDSPAKRDGLMEGDIITAVDGHAVLDIGYENAVNLFMGESGTKVSFEVLRGTEEWEVTVTRGMYDPQTVFAETVTVEGELYGYIQILQFEFSTSNQFISAVDKLMEMGAKGFVFDVRDNPGGYIDAAIAMLDYLLPEGPIVHFEARGEIETVSSDAHSVDLPMVVLVNGGTASSSELFASALKDYGKAEIVGEQTYGKGCVQEGIVLSDGSIIYITMYLYNPPFSENYDGVGIMPDHPIYLVKAWRSTDVLLIPHEEDNQLGKALDVLHINTKFTQ
jgi:carboxyl-terminal processing protease